MTSSNGIDRIGPAISASAFPDARRARMRGTAILLLAALAWGVGNVSQKTILDHLDAYAANGITCLVGAAVLYPFARREPSAPADGSFGLLLQVALAFTLAATLMQVGYGHTTVTNAGFLVNTAAVLTPVLGWLLYRQRPPFLIWPASLTTLAGVFLMGGGRLSSLVYGDLLILAAALVFAVWTLLVAQYVIRYGHPCFLTVMQLLFCGIVCIAISGYLNGVPDVSAVRAALPEIVMLGVVSKGLAYVLMAFGLRYVSAATGAVLVSAEAVFGAACAIVFLGESPLLTQVIGGFVIIGGVALASCAPARAGDDPRTG